MKKLLILILLAALCAGAYVSKPNHPKESLIRYMERTEQKNSLTAQLTAETSEFQDRYLWIDVKQDGKIIYTSLFHRWINRAQVKDALKRDVDAAKQKAEETREKIATH